MKPATNAPSGAIPLRFQFLWGWNLVKRSEGSNCTKDLSIPLRMKRFFSSTNNIPSLSTFQFLWGWNKRRTMRRMLMKNAFNSFEDETGNTTLYRRICFSFSFQFLWGWNLMNYYSILASAPLYFQFLWGWNKLEDNSIADMEAGVNFQFLWGWNPTGAR